MRPSFASVLPLLGLVSVLAACEVDPYCRTCGSDAGDDAGEGGTGSAKVDASEEQIIATGGGGSIRHCAVRAPGLGAAGEGLGLVTLLAGFGVALVRRRR